MPSIKPIYLRLLIFSFLILGLVTLGKLNSSRTSAGNLSGVSVTMSNSRLSFRGKVAADPGSGTIVTVGIDDGITDYTDGSATKVTDPLKVGDSLTFSTSGTRTIQEIIDGTKITLNNSVVNAETFYLDEESNLEAKFTTRTYLPAGSFQVMIPAHGTSATSQDGIPDQNYFDYDDWGVGDPSITCVGDGGTHSFATSVYTAAAYQTVSGYDGYWHTYTCDYTGGDASEEITMTIDHVINPAPYYTDASNKHATGVADTYEVVVRHLDSTDAEIDATTVKVGVIEAVRVSATVVPSLTFTITGQASGATRCGKTTTVTTTAGAVPLGELATGAFTYAAQNLKVTTNAKDGAVVTAIANDQLGLNGAACTGDTYNSTYECIWDANVTSMTHLDSTLGSPGEQDWTTTSEAGFGFTLEDVTDTNPDFEYNDGAGDFVARHFADAENSQDPQKLFDTVVSGTTTGPTNDSNLYVCYRALADGVTAAGEYYNYITYTATATF